MRSVPATDRRHFDAAQGWLALGDWRSANDELENITPLFRAHLVSWEPLPMRLVVVVPTAQSRVAAVEEYRAKLWPLHVAIAEQDIDESMVAAPRLN